MSKLPWFKFYPRDWLVGCAGLSLAERGVYITLIAMMYDERAPLVRDDGRLAKSCGLPKVGFTRVLESLIRCKKVTFDGFVIFNNRVGLEINHNAKTSVTASKNISSRWAKAKQKQASENTGVSTPYPIRIETRDRDQKAESELQKEPNPEIQVTSLEGLRQKRPAAPVSKAGLARVEIAKEGFERFWSIWPHKVGKPDAARSFLRVAGEVDAIVAGVERYIRDKPPDRSWLNPATFLNQRRWEDQPAPVSAHVPFERADNGMTTILKEIYENERSQNEGPGRDVPRLSVVSSNRFGRPDNA